MNAHISRQDVDSKLKIEQYVDELIQLKCQVFLYKKACSGNGFDKAMDGSGAKWTGSPRNHCIGSEV